MYVLILLTALGAGPTWQQQTLDLINAERLDADRREFAIYGELAAGHPRQPLEFDPVCAESAQWWCDALKSSGWFDHFGHVNARGFLIDPATGKQISRVWLPSQPDGLTYWGYRLRELGVERPWESSENGGLFSLVTPANIVTGWTRSGWNLDPRQATVHYSNLVNPNWTKAGLGKQRWGRGLDSVFCDFR